MEAGAGLVPAPLAQSRGTAALYGALVVHALLALWFLYERRTLRMPVWQATQVALGLCIPPLLLGHIMATRMAYTLFDTESSYTRILLALWSLSPDVGFRQAVTLTVAWIHGCMGVHFWLRFRPWYPRARTLLSAAALLLPVLALLGFVDGRPRGGEARRAAGLGRGDPARREGAGAAGARGAGAACNAASWRSTAAPWARSSSRAACGPSPCAGGTIRIAYPGGRIVQVTPGFTVLEASRIAGIPHASVCGGRGRCSTCRVRIVHGAQRPAGAERRGARACSAGSAHRPAFGWPVSSGRAATSPWSRCSPRHAPPLDRRARRPRPGPRAGGRGALRRPARLHPRGRAQAALRRRVPAQPLLRGRGHRHRARRRDRQPVHGRRGDGPLRRRDRARAWARARPWPRPARSSPTWRG